MSAWLILFTLASITASAQSDEGLQLTNEIRSVRIRLQVQQPALSDTELERLAYTLGHSNYLSRVIGNALRANDLAKADHLLKDFPGTVDEIGPTGGPTLLYRAVQLGNQEQVRFLLEHKSDPNRNPQHAETPLCTAIRFRRWPIALQLLEAGASATQTNQHGGGETPLSLAVYYQWSPRAEPARLQVLQKLLAEGANPLGPAGQGEPGSIVERVLNSSDQSIADLLLTNRPEPALRAPDGDTALHIAARFGRTNALEFLLAAGFSVDQTNTDGLTALQCVADSIRQPLAAPPPILTFIPTPFGPRSGPILTPYGTMRISAISGPTLTRSALPLNRPSPGFSVLPAVADSAAFLLAHGAKLDIFSAAALGRTNELDTFLRTQPFLSKAHDELGRTPLHYAVKAQQFPSARALLLSGAEVNARTTKSALAVRRELRQELTIPAGSTPLHIAALMGNFELEQLLLRAGALVTAQDNNGDTPLHLAVRQYQTNVVALLLSARAPLEVTNGVGDSPLRMAVKAGNPETVELMLRAGAQTPSATATSGSSLMHLAAAGGNPDMLKLLLRHGLALEARDASGRTPFQVAVLRGQLPAFSLLQAKGANVNAVDSEGNSALHLIAQVQYDSVGQWMEQPLLVRWKQDWLSRPGWRSQTLTKLIQWKVLSTPPTPVWTNVSMTGWLLNHGAKPNLTNRVGQTPLHLLCSASWLRYSDSAQTNRLAALLRAGAKVELPDAEGLSCLHLAASNAPPTELSLLLQAAHKSAPPRDRNGLTPLHYALNRPDGGTEGLATFLAAGFDPNVTDNQGHTPLHLAVIGSGQYPFGPRTGLLSMLLTNDANPNLADNQGLTPLHLAMQVATTNFNFNLHDIIEALLARHAKPNLRDPQGRTPLHWFASATGLPAHLERLGTLLVSGGWELSVRDHAGQTPLHLWAANLDAACGGCRTPLQAVLTRNKSPLNMTNGAGDTPLHIAINSNRYFNASLFMETGADPRIRNQRGESALRLVASLMPGNPFEQSVLPQPNMAGRGFFNSLYSVDRSSIDHWLAADPTLVNVTNAAGQTPLLLATEHKDALLTERLLNSGARLDLLSALRLDRMEDFRRLLSASTGPVQTNWLFEAVRFRRPDALADLIQAGGCALATDADGHSLLYRAKAQELSEMSDWLRRQGARETVFDALSRGEQAQVQQFLEADANSLNATNSRGRGPLWIAIASGHEELAAWLLSRGANPNLQIAEGWTPLHLAAARDMCHIGQELLAANSDPNQLTTAGMGPLHIAAAFGNTNFVTLLLDHGANVNLRPPESPGCWQNTPLHWAAHRGQVETVRLLRARGADPRALNKSGKTPGWEAQSTASNYYRGFPVPPEAWTRSQVFRTPTAAQRTAVLALLETPNPPK